MSRAAHLRAAREKRRAALLPAHGETQAEHDAAERKLRNLGLRPGTGGRAARHRSQPPPAPAGTNPKETPNDH